MRFMVIVKATKDSEAGKLPSTELLTAMGKFNEELVKAGVMLAGEGLQASSKGARVKIAGKNRMVMDGDGKESEHRPVQVHHLFGKSRRTDATNECTGRYASETLDPKLRDG
jgi:hypothetical protein